MNKTFRMPEKLLKRMEKVCDQKNISLNKLTVLCIEYALEHLEENEE